MDLAVDAEEVVRLGVASHVACLVAAVASLAPHTAAVVVAGEANPFLAEYHTANLVAVAGMDLDNIVVDGVASSASWAESK